MKKTLLFIVLICFSNTTFSQCYEYLSFRGTHTVGITAEGTLWGWGNSSFGELSTSNGLVAEPNPLQLGSESNWQSVYVGLGMTFAIKTDGTLWGTGSNQLGTLGVNTNVNNYTSFQQITTANNWVKVAPSRFFTVALKSDGTIWAWGQNDFNQTGQSPATAEQLAPMQVGSDTDWIDIATNTNRTAFALKANGTIWGWGSNGSSMIISGSGTTKVSTPTQVGTDSDWVKISVGGNQVHAQKADGTLWGWGSGSAVGLGISPIVTNTPQQISTDTWKSFSAGGETKSFGVKSDGTLWAWGLNTNGQLADGTTETQLVPVQVGSDSNWENVYAGAFITTLATKTDGTVWYWGRNYDGEFGIGIDLDLNTYTSPFQNPDVCVTATLSNPAFNVSNTVSLYPNPTKDFVVLDYDLKSENAYFGIYDLLGRQMLEGGFKNAKGQLTLETQDLPAGVYIVVIKDQNQLLWQEKLIIK